MSNISKHATLAKVGDWTIDLNSGVLSNSEETVDLDPTPLQLFKTLISQAGEIVSKEELLESVWPDRVVGDDALVQTISRLRKALGDNTKRPEYIETIPRKGYRLAKEVVFSPSIKPDKKSSASKQTILISVLVFALLTLTILWLVMKGAKQPDSLEQKHADKNTSIAASLTDKADDFYFQYTRADNEAAIDLYQQAMATQPDYALSQSGLANALVQKVLRWPGQVDEAPVNHENLLQALNDGRTKTDSAVLTLHRAEQLALRSVRLDPNNADIRKALGLVYATQSKFELAEKEYKKAIQIDPNAWGAMINLSDIYQVRGENQESIKILEKAFESMDKVYEKQAVRVRPWQPGLGNLIGERYTAQGKNDEAEVWFRHVLSLSPFHPDATQNLIRIILKRGDEDSARLLCEEYESKIGILKVCHQTKSAKR